MKDEVDIQKMQDILKPFLDIEQKSRDLIDTVPRAKLYIGISGIRLGFDSIELNDCVSIRKVENSPGIVHLCRAANPDMTDHLSVGRYSAGIGAELVLGKNDTLPDSMLFDIGWHIAGLIKIRGFSSLFCPASATCSWDLVNCITDQSIDFRLLDDVPKRIIVNDENTLRDEDIGWISRYWRSAFKLRDKNESRRFGLAFNIIYTWNQTNDLRIALANIWCGLDALFGKQNDRPVTQKLIERICNWLPDLVESDLRSIYDIRCDAVHGRLFDDREIGLAIRSSEKILRSALIRAIETETKTLSDWIKT